MEVGTGYGLLVQLLRTCALCICHCDAYVPACQYAHCLCGDSRLHTIPDVVRDVCDHIEFDGADAVITNCHPLLSRRYHHTVPMSNVYALREGLAILAEEVSLTRASV